MEGKEELFEYGCPFDGLVFVYSVMFFYHKCIHKIRSNRELCTKEQSFCIIQNIFTKNCIDLFTSLLCGLQKFL